MGGTNLFSLCRRVNQEELDAFAASWNLDDGLTCRPCCGPDYFRFDLTGRPRSPWNKSAARVFASDFMSSYQVPKRTFGDTMEAFFVRIKSLQAQYRLQVKGPTMLMLARARRRREYQKYSVSILNFAFPQITGLTSTIFSFSSGAFLLHHLYLSCDDMSICWNNWE